MARRGNPWVRLGVNAWSLGLEAFMVIGLRTMKIAAGGPAAEIETRRMVDEKVNAAVALQTLAMTGGLGNACRYRIEDDLSLLAQGQGQ